MGSTTALRRELKRRFLPLARERGFVPDQRRMPASITFRRSAGADVHIFSIQWEKYGKPRFAVRFGTCPGDGARFGNEVFAAADTLPDWLPDAGTLQPRRGTSSRAWFRQDRPLLQRLAGRPRLRPEAEVVDELIRLFAELERYWAGGSAGPHMRHWRIHGVSAETSRGR